MDNDTFRYIEDRVDDQISYFDNNAIKNQRYYRWIKSTAIVCNLFTTIGIGLAFAIPKYFQHFGIAALLLSFVVLATYQWEEFQNFGAKWEKFRLVAEQLKSEKHLFLNNAGRYLIEDSKERERLFVTTVENVIRGTDISYFSLIVEPGKRIEKRLDSSGRDS